MPASSPIKQAVIKQSIIPAIIEQHAEEAAFLWMQRDAAASEPHYSLSDLAALDERVEAHIDGLRIAAQPGWEICSDALDEPDAGTIFTAAVLAFESSDNERIKKVIKAGSDSDETFCELVSALGWINQTQFAAMLTRLINSHSLPYQRLAISACAIRRQDSAQIIEQSLANDDPYIKARALRAIGEFKRHDLAPALSRYQNTDADCQFWAAWSSILLQGGVLSGENTNNSNNLAIISHHTSHKSPLQKHALQLILRVLDVAAAKSWLQGLAKKAKTDPASLRTLLIAIGIFGDPIYIPTLITQMNNPQMARVAGESFTLITSVDLAYDDLDGDWPEDFEAGPTDEPEDQDVAMDIDESLPWPDVELISNWWKKHQGQFKAGNRYLMAKPISIDHCNEVLKNAMQRQRSAAAMELALLQSNVLLINVKVPGGRQLLEVTI